MTQPSIDSVVELLEAALRPGTELGAYIKRAQELVWSRASGSAEEEPTWSVLRDLAYDLDFFEPDADSRAADSSYFGEERARDEIQTALRRIRSL